LAVVAHKVPECSASLGDGFVQDFADRIGEHLVAVQRDSSAIPLGSNAGSEQRFVRVDIADAHHDAAIHDQRFDRDPMSSSLLIQVVAVKAVLQWLRPESLQ